MLHDEYVPALGASPARIKSSIEYYKDRIRKYTDEWPWPEFVEECKKNLELCEKALPAKRAYRIGKSEE